MAAADGGGDGNGDAAGLGPVLGASVAGAGDGGDGGGGDGDGEAAAAAAVAGPEAVRAWRAEWHGGGVPGLVSEPAEGLLQIEQLGRVLEREPAEVQLPGHVAARDLEGQGVARVLGRRQPQVRDVGGEDRADPPSPGALALAVSVASAVGERDVAAYATLQLALLDEQIGNQAGAEQAYDSLVDHAFLSHDLALRAQVHAGLGRPRRALGRTDDAHRAWLLALPAFEDGADPWALAVVLDGLVATGGRFERARRAAWLTQAQGLWHEPDADVVYF